MADIKHKLRKGEAAVEMIKINKFGVQRIARDTTDFQYYRNSISLRNGISEGKFPQYPRYGLTDTIYYAALIVRHNSKKPELVLLTKGKEMEGLWFKMYRNAARYQVSDNSSYQYYWKPIKEKLQGIRKIYFRPKAFITRLT